MFSPVFLERMEKLKLDVSMYERYPRKSIHILKERDEIVERFNLSPLPWAENCFWIDEFKEILQRYYDSVFVQDPASVVPVLAMNIKPDDVVVDLCAAPGSKTLHLAQQAQFVIANDSHRIRLRRLNHNLRRFSITNCAVTCEDARRLHLDTKVDRILVDAPCTGEGMVGKIHKAMRLWSVRRIKMLSTLQKQLVNHGLSLLKEGGILVYSTCTFAPEENEEVIDHVLQTAPATLEQISLKNLHYTSGIPSWKGKEYSPLLKKTIRIYPFHNCTNGFFVARMRKLGP